MAGAVPAWPGGLQWPALALLRVTTPHGEPGFPHHRGPPALHSAPEKAP